MMTYSEKLKDPRWQRKRLEVLDLHNFSCCFCGDTENTLHVHHREYQKGREPWDYGVENFLALCAPCHEGLEQTRKELVEIINEGGLFLGAAVSLCKAAKSGHICDVSLMLYVFNLAKGIETEPSDVR